MANRIEPFENGGKIELHSLDEENLKYKKNEPRLDGVINFFIFFYFNLKIPQLLNSIHFF